MSDVQTVWEEIVAANRQLSDLVQQQAAEIEKLQAANAAPFPADDDCPTCHSATKANVIRIPCRDRWHLEPENGLTDEEMVPHAFRPRPSPHSIWCAVCDYHRYHAVHEAVAAPRGAEDAWVARWCGLDEDTRQRIMSRLYPAYGLARATSPAPAPAEATVVWLCTCTAWNGVNLDACAVCLKLRRDSDYDRQCRKGAPADGGEPVDQAKR